MAKTILIFAFGPPQPPCSGRVLILALTLNGLNIVLDWYFIYHLNFEAMGAGLATLIASILSCCLGLFFVIQLTPTIQLPTVTQLLDSAKLKSLFSLNFNLLIRTLFLITVFALFTNISSLLGVLVLAANTISLKIIATGAYFIDGFAFSLEAIAGKSFGAQNSTILRSSLYLALTYTFLTVALFSIGIYFFAPELYGVFASAAHHPSVITLGASHRLFVIATLFCAGAAYIFDGFFIGMARGDILRRSMVFSTVLGFIPGAVLALAYSNVAFLWSALICFMLLRSITLGVHIKRVMRCVFDQSTVQDAP